MGKVDRLTELPEPIIHHILSFLPVTDATKTSTLCKRFRSLWYSFPIIYLDETLIHNNHSYSRRLSIHKFLGYVHDFLHRRPPNIALQTFSFHVGLNNKGYDDKSDDRIDAAINYALQNNVKELDLDVAGEDYNNSYRLPLAVLSATSITVLELKGFKLLLEPQEDLTLIGNFSFLEELSLASCTGVKTLKLISCDRLKRVDIDSCFGLEKVDVASPNIESFFFHGEEGKQVVFEISSREFNSSVKHLSLKNVQTTDSCLMGEFAKLQSLKLCGCISLTILYIRSPSLKTMELKNCSMLHKIEVVAPNLESFIQKKTRNLYDVNITACKSLKRIELERAQITDHWLEHNVSDEGLACLEDVKLCNCNMLQKFKISHGKLKRFEIRNCNNLEDAKLDARDIISFVCRVRQLPERLVVDFPQAHVQLFLEMRGDVHESIEWFIRLRDVLVSFDHCRELKLICRQKLLMVPEDLRKSLLSPMYDLKHLKVELSKPREQVGVISNKETEQQFVDLMDSLLWLAPRAASISVLSYLDEEEKSLKFEYSLPPVAPQEDCCRWKPVKCWRHYLKQVTMENFQASEKKILQKFITERAMRLVKIY